MNPRRVHALMTAHFPPVDPATLVQIHRKLGDLIAKDQPMAYIQDHVGKGQIRLAGRDFRGYVLIAANGVAAGWSAA